MHPNNRILKYDETQIPRRFSDAFADTHKRLFLSDLTHLRFLSFGGLKRLEDVKTLRY